MMKPIFTFMSNKVSKHKSLQIAKFGNSLRINNLVS